MPRGGEGQREGSKAMKSWIKYGLAGALILVASFWGGSVRAAEMLLGRDAAVAVQITGQDAAVLTGASFLPLGE
ncbi:beta-lactamase [Aeromonas hydrophila 4AK4]|nr:beta-lactamase [Aeromonas hydrophila 4AK4]